jgi:hypothetical protein
MSKKDDRLPRGPGSSEQPARSSPFLLYGGDDDKVRVRVLLRDETIWLSLSQMAELFDVGVPAISKHLKNVYDTGELERGPTVSKMETVQAEGERQVRRRLDYYNLDAIIAVGYRVNSHRATRFRIWATGVLREYIVKGFALDDERLEQGRQTFGADYFRELLERVRSIRASERRIWQQITDIFAECSIDYDPRAEITHEFFATVQNKFHYAITGQTAAEIIHAKSDRNAPHMGLRTWKHAPAGRVLASDVTVAKNYLAESDVRRLERTVSGFFDYIENIIENRQLLNMADMATAVDRFLDFNEFRVLGNKGVISKKQADSKALAEYAEFNLRQKIESDFDRFVKTSKALENAAVPSGKRERRKES